MDYFVSGINKNHRLTLHCRKHRICILHAPPILHKNMSVWVQVVHVHMDQCVARDANVYCLYSVSCPQILWMNHDKPYSQFPFRSGFLGFHKNCSCFERCLHPFRMRREKAMGFGIQKWALKWKCCVTWDILWRIMMLVWWEMKQSVQTFHDFSVTLINRYKPSFFLWFLLINLG